MAMPPGPGLGGPGGMGMMMSGKPVYPTLMQQQQPGQPWAVGGWHRYPAAPPFYAGGGRQMATSPPSSRPGDTLSRTNLYIRGLSAQTTDKDLVNLCQKFGTIISTKAILDKATNRCKGYGFVDFESPTSALAAVNELQGQGIQAQMARQAEQDPTNLYIANLPHHVKENDLETMFSPYGQVISTRILRDPSQQSRGVGFARMESRDRCEQIISLFNARALPGSSQALVVKFADGSGSRRKTNLSSPDPTWSGEASTDGSDNALSPESMHSNGSALPVGSSPLVQTYTYTSRPAAAAGLPYHLLAAGGSGGAAAATGSPLMAARVGGGQPPSWIPTSGGGAYIIQSPTGNPLEMYPISSSDPYTCIVSGMQGLMLSASGYGGGGGGGGVPPPQGSLPPGAQLIHGPYGYQILGLPATSSPFQQAAAAGSQQASLLPSIDTAAGGGGGPAGLTGPVSEENSTVAVVAAAAGPPPPPLVAAVNTVNLSNNNNNNSNSTSHQQHADKGQTN